MTRETCVRHHVRLGVRVVLVQLGDRSEQPGERGDRVPEPTIALLHEHVGGIRDAEDLDDPGLEAYDVITAGLASDFLDLSQKMLVSMRRVTRTRTYRPSFMMSSGFALSTGIASSMPGRKLS